MKKEKLEEMNILSINNLKVTDKIVVKNKKNKLLYEGYLMPFVVKMARDKQQSLFDFMFSCGRTGDKLFKVL